MTRPVTVPPEPGPVEATMPQRLRTLADFLEFWDLPDTNVFLLGGEYAGQVSVTATGREILRWSTALGTPVTVLDFPDATPPWKAHTTAGTFSADGVVLDIRVQWSEVLEDAPVGVRMSAESGDDAWFSDEALRRQAALRAWDEEGAPPPLALLVGIYEPRTQPEPHERCDHCYADGRDGAGGAERHGVRWCQLCLGRGRDDDYPGGAA